MNKTTVNLWPGRKEKNENELSPSPNPWPSLHQTLSSLDLFKQNNLPSTLWGIRTPRILQHTRLAKTSSATEEVTIKIEFLLD